MSQLFKMNRWSSFNHAVRPLGDLARLTRSAFCQLTENNFEIFDDSLIMIHNINFNMITSRVNTIMNMLILNKRHHLCRTLREHVCYETQIL